MKNTLLLNSDYMPIKVISWQRAVCMWFSDKVEIVEEYNDFDLRSVSFTMKCPAVVRLLSYVKAFRKSVKFSRINIFHRDKMTCFAKGTKIILANGKQVPIETIQIGDQVIDAFGNPQKVIATGNTLANNLISLKRKRAFEKTYVTQDHEFLTPQQTFETIGNKPQYIVAPRKINLILKNKAVNLGDYLSRNKWYRYKNGRIFCSRRSHEKGIPSTLYPSRDLAYLLGLYCAEGCSAKNGLITWSYSQKENKTLVEDTRHLIKNLFNIPVSVDYYETKTNVRTNSKLLSEVLIKNCGKGCYNKKIPWDLIGIYTSDFLKGLFLGDAYITRENKKVVLSLTSEQIIYETQTLLWDLGIVPSIQTNKRGNRHKTWSLVLQGDCYSNFMEKILNEKVESGKITFGNDNLIFCAVKEIKEIKDQIKVYNLQVENTESYIANGISVHNCQYCGIQPGIKNLTFEHIIPKSKGGKTNWENITTACYPCNIKKGNKTLKETKMKLLSIPKEPKRHVHTFLKIRLDFPKTPEAWRDYLYWNQKLEE